MASWLYIWFKGSRVEGFVVLGFRGLGFKGSGLFVKRPFSRFRGLGFRGFRV